MATATELIDARKWAEITLDTDEFKIHGYRSLDFKSPIDDLHVYIEGDGFAWRTRTQPSSDPTPLNPIALKLALRDPSSTVIYLARPCQYSAIGDPNCSKEYWTNKRFSTVVIETYQELLNRLVQEFRVKTLTLIGYSGGGAIAALLSGTRNDVKRLITIAGNLDTYYWTDLHQVTPLMGSLNPATDTSRLATVAQWHFVGADDWIVPPSVSQHYFARFSDSQNVKILTIPHYTHHCCWVENWPALLQKIN